MNKRHAPRPEDVISIAERMRVLRKTTGLSQEAFADFVGLGYAQWGNIEAARNRIGIDAALALTHKLGIPLDWTYLGEERWLPMELRSKLNEAADALAAAPRRAVRRAS